MLNGKFCVHASLVGTLLAGLVPANAADSATPAVASLEEIIVTATRRAEPLQDIPMSVTVVDGEALQKAGAFDYNDAGFSAGNVVFNESGHNPFISAGPAIRGISGRAGVYIDDVLLGPGQAMPSQLVDIERIEILRGPQGTTFGRNTIAGAMNLITRTPSFSWTGIAGATFGSYGLRQQRAYLSGPLLQDTLAFSISGFSRRNDGVEKTLSGRRVSDTRTEGGRASLFYQPSDALDVQLAYDYTHDNPHAIWAWHLLFANPGAVGQAADPSNIGKVLDPSFNSTTDQTHQGATLRINWRFNDAKLTSISAYRDTDSTFYQDLDRIEPDILASRSRIQQHQFTQEVKLESQWRQLRWLAGAFYLKNEQRNPSNVYINGDATFFGPSLDDLAAAGAIPYAQLIQSTAGRDPLQSKAVYASADFDVTDKLRLTAGARYTWDEIDSESAQSDAGPFGVGYDFGPTPPPVLAPFVFPTLKKERFDPSFSAGYAFAEDIRGYFAVATGYQTAAYNSAAACQGPTALVPCLLKPEEVVSYEAGMKSEWWDHRLKVNVAAYFMDYKNLQVFQSFIVDGDIIFTNSNAAKSSARGAEIEIAIRPVESLTIDGSIGHTRTKYDSFPNAFVPTDSGTPLNADLSGEDLAFSPHWTGSLNGQYQRPIINSLDLITRVETQFRSGYQMNPSPARTLQVGSQTNVNVAVGLQSAQGWSIWGRGRNILDRSYPENADINGWSNAGYVTRSDPSIYSLELQYQF